MYYLDLQKFSLMRAREGKTLKELGIDPNLLVRARKGRQMQASTIAKLASVLHCDVIELIADEPNEREVIS